MLLGSITNLETGGWRTWWLDVATVQARDNEGRDQGLSQDCGVGEGAPHGRDTMKLELTGL